MNEKKPGEPSDGTAMLGFPRMGRLFRSRRVEKGLKIVEVARLAGLRDTPKVLRNMDLLEREGLAPLELVKTLCVFFGIGLQEVREAWKLDEVDRKRLRWESDGGRPYLVIRFMPSVYRRSQVPEGVEGRQAIEWAQAALRERWEGRFKGCLVLSRDEIAWFSEDGAYYVSRDICLPPCPFAASASCSRSEEAGDDAARNRRQSPGGFVGRGLTVRPSITAMARIIRPTFCPTGAGHPMSVYGA